FYVRAGLDRPAVNERISAIASQALRQNAPITLWNYPGGHHAFEIVDINEASRDVIEQSFRFLHSALAPGYQAALRAGMPEASAAAAVLSRDFARASSLYQQLAHERPQDPRVRLSYAEALLGASQYKAARHEFDQVKALGNVGPRDLGLPA